MVVHVSSSHCHTHTHTRKGQCFAMGEENNEFDLYEDLFLPVALGLGDGETQNGRGHGDSVRVSNAELEDLRVTTNKLTAQNSALKKNISCLYKTAQQELQRKESMIDRLMTRIKKLEAKSKRNEMQSIKLATPFTEHPIQLATPTTPPSKIENRHRTGNNKTIDCEGGEKARERLLMNQEPLSSERTHQLNDSSKRRTPSERTKGSQGDTCKHAEGDDPGMGRTQEPVYSATGQLSSSTAVKGGPVSSPAVLSEGNSYHQPSNLPNSGKENRRGSGEYLSRQSRKRKLSSSSSQRGEVVKHRNQLRTEGEKLDLSPPTKRLCASEMISSDVGVSQGSCSKQAAGVSEVLSVNGHYWSCLSGNNSTDLVFKAGQPGRVDRNHKLGCEPVSNDKIHCLEERSTDSAWVGDKNGLYMNDDIQFSNLPKHEQQEALTSQIIEDTLEHRDNHSMSHPELDTKEQPESLIKVQTFPEAGIGKTLQGDPNFDRQGVPIKDKADDSSTHSVGGQEDIEEGEVTNSDSDNISHKEDIQEGERECRKQSDYKCCPNESPNSHPKRRRSSQRPSRRQHEKVRSLEPSRKENGRTKSKPENTSFQDSDQSKSTRYSSREPRVKELPSRSARVEQQGARRYQRAYSREKQDGRHLSRSQTRRNN